MTPTQAPRRLIDALHSMTPKQRAALHWLTHAASPDDQAAIVERFAPVDFAHVAQIDEPTQLDIDERNARLPMPPA